MNFVRGETQLSSRSMSERYLANAGFSSLMHLAAQWSKAETVLADPASLQNTKSNLVRFEESEI